MDTDKIEHGVVPGVVDLRGGTIDDEVAAAAGIVVWTLTRELPHRQWAIVDRSGHAVSASVRGVDWRTAGLLAEVQLDDDDHSLRIMTDAHNLPSDGIEAVAARACARLLLSVVTSARRARQAELAADRAWWVASVDPVTRVLNARGWWARIDELADADPAEEVVACFVIDNLAQINARHGHLHGDLVLRVAAEHVSALLRPGDAIARLGGATFIALVHGSGVDEVVEQISAAVAVDGVDARVGAAMREADEPIRATMARADLDLRDRPLRSGHSF